MFNSLKILLLTLALNFASLSCTDSSVKEVQPSKNIHFSKANIKIPESYEKKYGVELFSCGPRGGVHVSKEGNSYSYRIFRLQLVNDSVKPMELNIELPEIAIPQNTFVLNSIHAFLIPQEYSPERIIDTFNFGVKNIEQFLETGLTKSTTVNKKIKPNENCVLYFGCLVDGVARAYFNLTESISKDNQSNNSNLVINCMEFDLNFHLNTSNPSGSNTFKCGVIKFID
ncbi:MAG: hypothetical protein IPM51_15420 [Sphingobacteriaceae bacterium]|nr:hypothetical protein [Sphingobacteriaceae bacterium]